MNQKQVIDHQVEILAPAGSYESFRAAILAGADAVYAGGPRFGARAYAENFTEELLIKAIDYAHLHGRKFYLTVNTLLKDSEIHTLREYLEPLYLGGLDAVIVQDLGVVEYIRRFFPDMDIHASTQMTVTSCSGAEFLRHEGVTRIVPARELSLVEIRNMKAHTGMEIECFVHGALCYCYSGQCLLSSLIGGRSGNRGQCAQPCRLPYTIDKEKKHWLSPKDICALELIPDLAEAGIDSFKIEGRMKRPEYVAGVTAMYRKYLDLYLHKGRAGFRVSETDKEFLLDLYNRGGFNSGYYKQHNGRDMLSLNRPNHAGVPVVQVTAQKGRELSGKALTEIHKGDVIEFQGKQENYTFGGEFAKGASVHLLAPKGQTFSSGTILYRTKNEQLLTELAEAYSLGKIKEKIYGSVRLSVGKPAKLTLRYGDLSVTVASEEKVEQAASRPLEEERIRKQMKKTGNTEFEFVQLDVFTDGNVFLGMQQLNELRRQGIERLEKAICDRGHRVKEKNRNAVHERMEHQESPYFATEKETASARRIVPELRVFVETKEQLSAVSEEPEVKRVYIDSAMNGELIEQTEALAVCRKLQKQGKEVFLAMPHVFREKTEKIFWERYRFTLDQEFDGVLVRNLETLQFLKRCGFDRKVILDHNLYIFNSYTKDFWNRHGIEEFTLPLELNRSELQTLGAGEGELVIYGYLPVMISAQCVTNTVYGCKKKEGMVVLRDRLNHSFTVRNHCRECYNVIYNSSPLYLLDQKKEIKELDCPAVRLQFSKENERETKAVLDVYRRALEENIRPAELPEHYTRGHFKRGVL